MKKFIMFTVVAIMCSSLNAGVDSRNSSVTYDEAVELGRQSLNRKSIRTIIKEILERHRKPEKNYYLAPPPTLDLENTIPIPTEGLRNRFKNLV